MVAKTYNKTVTLLASLVFGMLGIGVIPGLVQSFETTYGLSHTSMGLLLALCSAGFILSAILSGIIADRLGIRRVLLATIALTASSAMIIRLLEWRPAFIVALAVFHMGSAHYTVLNSFVLSLYETRQTQGMNIFHAWQGIGRLLAPLLTALVISVTQSWTNVFLLSFLAYGLLGALFAKMPKCHDHSANERVSLSKVIGHMANAKTMLGIVAFFFLAGSELTLITWLAAYLETNAYLPQAQALYGLTFMLVGFTGIRFAIGILSIPVGKIFMVGALLLNIACCVGLLFVRALPLLYVMCVGLGLSVGAFWPCLASLLPRRLSIGRGLLMGLIALGSALGSLIFLSLVGWLADIFSLRIIFLVAPVCTIIFVALYLSLLKSPDVRADRDGIAGQA